MRPPEHDPSAARLACRRLLRVSLSLVRRRPDDPTDTTLKDTPARMATVGLGRARRPPPVAVTKPNRRLRPLSVRLNSSASERPVAPCSWHKQRDVA